MYLKNLFTHWAYQVFSPGTVLRTKYEAFKTLLASDKRAHEIMAELEQIHYGQLRVDMQVLVAKYETLSACVAQIVENLIRISPVRYLSLRDYFKKFDFYIRFMLAPPQVDFSPPFALRLENIPVDGRQLAGGKAFNLSRIKSDLQLPVPRGFVITTNAFSYFLEANGIREIIEKCLAGLDIYQSASLQAAADELSTLILEAEVPAAIEDEIETAFAACWPDSKPVRLAVRSSAVGEDGRSSFAGQYRTLLNVGRRDLMTAYKQVVASKYTASSIFYRVSYGLSDFETPMAVLAIEMVDALSSGILYTLDLEDSQAQHQSIHAIWGLGELLVGGRIAPDVIRVSKTDPPAIVAKAAAEKTICMQAEGTGEVRTAAVPAKKSHRASIDDDIALQLARWGMQLEDYYGEPQDVEWCLDRRHRLYLLQSRPLHREPDAAAGPDSCNFPAVDHPVLLSGGEPAAAGVGAGRVYRMHQGSAHNPPAGSVLVAKNALPRYVAFLDRASAVITDTGGAAGHFASVAREFGVPTLVNTGNAFGLLADKTEVTVHAEARKVYAGIVSELLESPCARRNLMADSPFTRRLAYMIDFISPLKLVDPEAGNFTPEHCRSMHDIIRFAHEKAVQEMFAQASGRFRKIRNAKKLVSDVPLVFYLLDVGGGMATGTGDRREIDISEIISRPLRALWKGMTHPDIRWSGFVHYDWAQYDNIVMSGGWISKDSALLASYAVISADYMNLNLKFGYHFVIIDAICTDNADENYLLFRFTGGGGDFEGRSLRADFITAVLDRLGYAVQKKGDLVDAELKGTAKQTMAHQLDMLGRLLGATRLMDMYLKDAAQIEKFAEAFMKGRYHFASVTENAADG